MGTDIFTFRKSSEHKTRAEIEAIENPQHEDQYYDTTNNVYVVYIAQDLPGEGEWLELHFK